MAAHAPIARPTHDAGAMIVASPGPTTTKLPVAISPLVRSLPGTARSTLDGSALGACHSGGPQLSDCRCTLKVVPTGTSNRPPPESSVRVIVVGVWATTAGAKNWHGGLATVVVVDDEVEDVDAPAPIEIDAG